MGSFLSKNNQWISYPILILLLLILPIPHAVANSEILIDQEHTQLINLESGKTLHISGNGNINRASGVGVVVRNISDIKSNIIIDSHSPTSPGINTSSNSPAIKVDKDSNILSSIELKSGSITSLNSAIFFLSSSPITTTTHQDTTISGKRALYLRPTAEANYSINNSGTISGSFSAIHNFSRDSHSKMTINNSGTISGDSFSIRAEAKDNSSSNTIINQSSGIINGTILFRGNTESMASIENYGTINAKITASSNTYDLDIVNNSGSITRDIALGSHADSSFTLNNGTIKGNLSSGNSSQKINLNNGSFIGNISLSGGTINIKSTSITGSINGQNQNQGTVNIIDDITFKSSTSFGDQAALNNINIAQEKTVNFNGFVNSNNLNIGNNAILNIQSNDIYANNTHLSGSLNFGNKNRTFNSNVIGNGTAKIYLNNQSHIINGNLTLTKGDELSLKILNSNNFGNLTTNIASISSDAKLNLDISRNYRFISNGEKFNIVNAKEGSNINAINSKTITVNNKRSSNLKTLSFVTYEENNNLILEIKRIPATNLTPNKSAQNAYDAINSIGDNATGTLKSFQEFLDNSEDDTQISEALNSATPQDSASVGINQVNTINGSLKTTENRMNLAYLSSPNSNNNSKSGISSGDSYVKHGIWGQTFGTYAKQEDIESNDGYRSNSLGMAFGYDTKLTPNVILGAAFSYANSTIESLDSIKETDIDIYQINFYGGKKINQYFLDTTLGFAWNEYKSNRTISSIDSTASAEYNGQSYIAKIRNGFITKINDSNFNLIPQASINFIHNRTNAYRETGAQTMNLRVKESSSDFLEGRLGLTVQYETLKIKNSTITPKIDFSYGYNFLNDRQSTTINFVGQTTTFNDLSAKIDPQSLKIGGGVNIFDMDSTTITAEYIMEHRNKFQSHTGALRARFEF